MLGALVATAAFGDGVNGADDVEADACTRRGHDETVDQLQEEVARLSAHEGENHDVVFVTLVPIDS